MNTRHFGIAAALAPLLLAMGLGPPPSDNPIDAIEEDWELVVGEPDVASSGPQITTTMSPTGNTLGESMSFNLNYRDDPFGAGGFQLRAWQADEVTDEVARRTAQFETSGELVTWTQRMELVNGQLRYEVKNGESTTWGTFGQGEVLRVTASTTPSHLDAYSPAESVANSGPGWQSNRVTRMRLLRVRYYSQGQLLHTDETVRTVIDNAQ